MNVVNEVERIQMRFTPRTRSARLVGMTNKFSFFIKIHTLVIPTKLGDSLRSETNVSSVGMTKHVTHCHTDRALASGVYLVIPHLKY